MRPEIEKTASTSTNRRRQAFPVRCGERSLVADQRDQQEPDRNGVENVPDEVRSETEMIANCSIHGSEK
jgi:hypothetical protein